MILQNEFRENGYTDILEDNVASTYGINLEEIFDLQQRPEELLGIFISEQKDELFFLLNGDLMEISVLCNRWDDRIRVFTIINGQSGVIKKLKYNMMQLIIYSNGTPDRSCETNLLMSRKIIIKGNMDDREKIVIDDDEAIELPFHMIPTDAFTQDVEQLRHLRQLLPRGKELLVLTEEGRTKGRRKEREGVYDKIFEAQDYEKIKEWLER